jgi:AraC-like DNA-binding protein
MLPVDRLQPIFERFRIDTHLFHAGRLCGSTVFAARPGQGFLHVLRSGLLDVSYVGERGDLVRREITEPSLLFFARPLEHVFHNPPVDGADFVCAALQFSGGQTHPLVQTLPDLVVVPLAQVPGLRPALDMLFTEVEETACGNRLVTDRLFEVVLIQLLRWMMDNANELHLPPSLLTGLADEQLAPVLTRIHEQPGAGWTLARMAGEARMSRSALAERFKHVMGQSPGEYVNRWRLTVGQERLRAGASVAVVAGELGYANASAFSRMFSQQLGVSPRAWTTAEAVSPALPSGLIR